MAFVFCLIAARIYICFGKILTNVNTLLDINIKVKFIKRKTPELFGSFFYLSCDFSSSICRSFSFKSLSYSSETLSIG